MHAWPVDGPNEARLEQVHRWISACSDFPIIPIPERTLDGRSFLRHEGRLWEVTRWMPGEPSPTVPVNLRHVRLAFETLARIHRRLQPLQVTGSSPGLQTRARELEEFLARGHAVFESILQRSGNDPEVGLATRWLSLARDAAPAVRRDVERAAPLHTSLQPCLRDARHAHFLFDGDALAGLIDFGAMGIDSVSGDLARLIGDWFPDDRLARSEALQAYESLRPLSFVEQGQIVSFERANAILIGAHWMRWRFIDGRTFEQRDAVTQGLIKSIERMTAMGR